jgi:hypothetical protein
MEWNGMEVIGSGSCFAVKHWWVSTASATECTHRCVYIIINHYSGSMSP